MHIEMGVFCALFWEMLVTVYTTPFFFFYPLKKNKFVIFIHLGF